MSPHEEFRANLADLRNIVKNFRIVGAAGSFQKGYQIQPGAAEAAEGEGVSGPPVFPPPPPTGACCKDGDCTIRTETNCNSIGGDYQGDDEPCEPNPCPPPPPTGACCRGSVCTIETAANCAVGGGVYQGDGTPCEPNPCELPSCDCGYPAFDGSGRLFLRKDAHYTAEGGGGHEDCCNHVGGCPSPGTNCDASWNCSGGSFIDPFTCEESDSGCQDPSGLTLYVCPSSPGDCIVSVVNCTTCGVCESMGVDCGSGCSCSATSKVCSITTIGGPATCTTTLSNECIPTALFGNMASSKYDELFT